MNRDLDPAVQHFNYGERLTRAEYERRVIALHTEAHSAAGLDEASKRRADLNLLIDFHLGVEFPTSRRSALWGAQDALQSHRGWHLVLGLIAHPRDPMATMAKKQVRAFAEVLNKQELKALLDLTDQELAELL